jgi:hypothetical protein
VEFDPRQIGLHQNHWILPLSVESREKRSHE